VEGNSEDLDWEDQDMCFFVLKLSVKNHHGKEHDLANRNMMNNNNADLAHKFRIDTSS
jgi:hypothetical protein